MDGKNFLVYDFGIFCENAAYLTEEGKNTVNYYTQWADAFPSFDKYIIGQGSGVNKVLTFDDHINEADCIINFDVYGNERIAWLREKGYRCFGSGKGMWLENDRWAQKRLLKQLGLPVNNAVKITGIPDLRDYLTKNKDKYVKIDNFRANLESFHAKDYESVELILNEMESTLGPFNDKFKFIVEDNIDADESVEPGVDAFFNGKQFIKPYLYGYEICKAFYVGKFVPQLPPQLQNTMDKLTPTLQKLDYRGAFSTEEKVVDKKTSYVLDICARQPAPLSAGYIEWFKNYTDLIWKISGAEDVEIQPIAPYVAAMPLECEHAKEHWVRMIIEDEKYRRNIKFRQFAKKNGKYYATPGMSGTAVVLGWGNSVEEAVNMVKKYMEMIDAYKLQKDVMGDVELANKQIETGKKMGIDF